MFHGPGLSPTGQPLPTPASTLIHLRLPRLHLWPLRSGRSLLNCDADSFLPQLPAQTRLTTPTLLTIPGLAPTLLPCPEPFTLWGAAIWSVRQGRLDWERSGVAVPRAGQCMGKGWERICRKANSAAQLQRRVG